MPYIDQLGRKVFDEALDKICPESTGELNYCITKLCLDFLNYHGIKYMTLNEVDGVLGCVQKEIYRRLTAPYEDKKMKENGDVFSS